MSNRFQLSRYYAQLEGNTSNYLERIWRLLREIHGIDYKYNKMYKIMNWSQLWFDKLSVSVEAFNLSGLRQSLNIKCPFVNDLNFIIMLKQIRRFDNLPYCLTFSLQINSARGNKTTLFHWQYFIFQLINCTI